jgi:hypothetical protein
MHAINTTSPRFKQLEKVVQHIEHQDEPKKAAGVMVQVLGFIPHSTASTFTSAMEMDVEKAVAAEVGVGLSNVMIGELTTQAHSIDGTKAKSHSKKEPSRLRFDIMIEGLDKEKADDVVNSVWSGEFTAQVKKRLQAKGAHMTHMHWPHFQKAGTLLTQQASVAMSTSAVKAKKFEANLALALHSSVALVILFAFFVLYPPGT